MVDLRAIVEADDFDAAFDAAWAEFMREAMGRRREAELQGRPLESWEFTGDEMTLLQLYVVSSSVTAGRAPPSAPIATFMGLPVVQMELHR